MTSEIEALKTNEFLRRRKLRLQQVREQSKDIAKHIRQRAKLEKLRQFEEVDARKQYDYIDRQEKLVRQLELLYANGIENVGASHKKASEVTLTENLPPKVDLSKVRAKEAATQLRLEKQQKLDEHKKLLDRKLQARETANGISRDKSKTVATQLQQKPLNNKCSDTKKDSNPSVTATSSNVNEGQIVNNGEQADKPVTVTKSDMATQWNYEGLPGEWDPSVPRLDLTQHEDISSKKTTTNREEKKNSQKCKRPNLFAVSDDMPNTRAESSYVTPLNIEPTKSSLTLITEYLKQKNLNLREPSASNVRKEHIDDLQSIKQTILRSKMTHPSGNVCLVHDEQVIPVPSWNPENCLFCSQPNCAEHKVYPNKTSNVSIKDKSYISAASVKRNNVISSNNTSVLTPSSVRRSRVLPKVKLDKDKSLKLNLQDEAGPQKTSVTIYNHSTRDSKHLHDVDNRVVIRDEPPSNDAYSLAMKEANETKVKEHDKKLQNMRNKVAMSKQSVEKEYKDTMAFLKSMSKEKASHANKMAFMSEQRQQDSKDARQRKMCQVFQKIETEYMRQGNPTANANDVSKSTTRADDCEYDSDAQDFQYSWMPVPEGDEFLAVHTIPTTVKETKPSKGVKFSQADSYHEYRSRHKHTPPTKDTTSRKSPRKPNPVVNDSSSEDSDEQSVALDAPNKRRAKNSESSDSQGIIIYKIIDSKSVKDKKKKKKVVINDVDSREDEQEKSAVSMPKQPGGGISKAVSGKMDDFSTVKISPEPIKLTGREGTSKMAQSNNNETTDKTEKLCDVPSGSVITKCGCSKNTEVHETDILQKPSQATTIVSNAPTMTTKVPLMSTNASFIKVLDEDGQESGKFYIGASGFLNKDNYEVVIQLRKKETNNIETVQEPARESVPTVDKKSEVILNEEKSKEVLLKADQKLAPADNAIEDVPDISPPQLSLCPSKSNLKEDEPPNIEVPQIQNEEKQSDANVCTEFVKQDDDHIRLKVSDEEQKCIGEIHVRPSISTQTHSFSNFQPIPRPPLFHLSSSTSTCYMSPPEKIMPKYLYQSARKGSSNEEYCHKCHHKHRKSRRSRKYSQDTVKLTESQKLITPHRVGSARSICDSRLSRQCRINKKQDVFKQSNDYLNFIQIKNNDTSHFKRKQSNTKLNPAIQNYINKLLGMSKESLKTLQVSKQECSSVSSPTESTINMPSNYYRRPKSVDLDDNISLRQIKTMLHQMILDNCYKIMPKKNNKYYINTRKRLQPSKNGRMKKASSQFMNKKQAVMLSLLPRKKEDMKLFVSDNGATTPVSSGCYSTTKSIGDNNKQHMQTCEDSDSNSACKSLLSYKTASKSRLKSQENVIKEVKSNKHNTPLTSSSEDRHISHNKKSKNIKTSNQKDLQDLLNTSTQTAPSVEGGDLMKLTETKIQNMEKIADLTEKCTHRLFNLAKVLEEVRKKKLTAYSHMSSDSSTEDQKPYQQEILIKSTSLNSLRLKSDKESAPLISPNNTEKQKPTSLECDKLSLSIARRKPPPAMSRINLKDSQGDVSPHELSTVAEVDSPLSSKVKSKSFQNEDRSTISQFSLNDSLNDIKLKKVEHDDKVCTTTQTDNNQNVNPDLLNLKLSRPQKNLSNTQQKKMQMMNLQKFNEIMLKPFVSIEEYAKQCDVSVLDDQFNIEDIPKETLVNDELSSLHSEGSLPDVIGELLKRNIISKPFEFESVSNVHSTSISSDSSMSALALSKLKKNKKSEMLKTKDASETSDSLSMSSNQDLENVFKNIGLGWASSTLKKTKERLALSSSSNTSGSGVCSKRTSINFARHDAYLATGETNTGSKLNQSRNITNLKTCNQQQTSLTSLTVQEFLDKELAQKITFSKSGREESEVEFISLCKTKMPEDMKNMSNLEADNGSMDSMANVNRARTSTPVQLYKCHTYHSSSSSHLTNGLFSNMDDLSSVKGTSGSGQNHTTSDKDDLTVPNCSLKLKKSS